MNYAQIKPCSIENGTGVRVSLFVSGCRHHCKECFNEEPENQQGLLPLLQRIKKELPDKNIWAYSGYLYEDFLPGGKVYCEASEPFLSMIDVMVDGPFILEKKDISLNFRGSSNQESSVKNKIFHTQDLCLRTNLRCPEERARNGE